MAPVNYLSRDAQRPVVAADDRPQAHRHSLSLDDHVLLSRSRASRRPDADGTADAAGRPGDFGDLQQTLHHPRRADGLVFSDPIHSGGARKFCPSDDDRRARRGVSEAESGELVSVHRRAVRWRSIRSSHGGVDTGWTFYTPYSSTYANSHVISMAAGIFIAGFSLHPAPG